VVANNLFITGNWKEDDADMDKKTGSSKKEWTRGSPERYIYIVVLRQHANCRLCTYTKEGYQSHVKATRKL
jgi:hypothetical protein